MHLEDRVGFLSAAHLQRAVGAVVGSLLIADASLAATPPWPALTDYSILHKVQTTAYLAQPVNSPPINGFIPQVVFNLTNESGDVGDGLAVEDDHDAGGQPALTAPAKYIVATFDTGAQSHILSYLDRAATGINSHMTANQADIIGSSGSETADISDPLGFYITGLANASNVGGNIAVTGEIKGHWNTSVLAAADEDSVLPNIVGAPIMANYQVSILNSQPQTLVIGATTYRSPSVVLTSLNPQVDPEHPGDPVPPPPTLPANYYRLTLEVQSPAGLTPTPAYIPNLDIFGGDFDPVQPTFWMSMFANINGSDAGNAAANKQFLFDTGAQVTVLSQDTAAEFGFYSGGPDPSTPEFFVPVEGVGGTIQVPGFTVDTLNVMTNGGPVVWHNVPVLVLDLPDARDGVGFLPGVLGMNLFTDRDLILNGGLTNPAVAFSQQMQWGVNGAGLWSENAKWILGTPNNPDRPAQFLGRITSPQTITVDSNFTAGSLVFDNNNRYTLSGGGRITLQSFLGDSSIGVFAGSHTINAPMTLSNATTINIAPAGEKLTITSDVIANGVAITKAGDGTVEMKNIRAAALNINAGRVTILPVGSAAGTSKLATLSIAGGGKLDLKDNDLIVAGGVIGSWNGSSYTGVQGLVAAGLNGGDWNGGGIITSQTAALTGLTILGVSTGQAALNLAPSATTTWSGQTVAGADVLVMYTYSGDANLDGIIDGTDYFFIDSNVGTSADGYANGDFNYDGTIDGTDYFYIDSNIVGQGPPLTSSAEILSNVPIPEPSTTAVLILASGSLLSRCRRRTK